MTNVTKFDIALIGVKLLAVYMAIVVIETLPNWIMTAGMVMTPANSIILKLGVVLVLAITIIIPIFLWILSNKIAYIITPPSTESRNSERVDNDLQAIIFRGIGMYVLIMALPQLILWLHSYTKVFTDSTLSFFDKMPDISILIAILLKIILSVILIFSAKHISMFFSKLRSAGSEK
jgi:hypothetical protein